MIVPPSRRLRHFYDHRHSSSSESSSSLKNERLDENSRRTSIYISLSIDHVVHSQTHTHTHTGGAFYEDTSETMKGKGALSWALSLKKSGEEEDSKTKNESSKKTIEMLKDVAKTYEKLESRIGKHLKSYFDSDYVQIASLCASTV